MRDIFHLPPAINLDKGVIKDNRESDIDQSMKDEIAAFSERLFRKYQSPNQGKDSDVWNKCSDSEPVNGGYYATYNGKEVEAHFWRGGAEYWADMLASKDDVIIRKVEGITHWRCLPKPPMEVTFDNDEYPKVDYMVFTGSEAELLRELSQMTRDENGQKET